jgi:hypothetical protein
LGLKVEIQIFRKDLEKHGAALSRSLVPLTALKVYLAFFCVE